MEEIVIYVMITDSLVRLKAGISSAVEVFFFLRRRQSQICHFLEIILFDVGDVGVQHDSLVDSATTGWFLNHLPDKHSDRIEHSVTIFFTLHVNQYSTLTSNQYANNNDKHPEITLPIGTCKLQSC